MITDLILLLYFTVAMVLTVQNGEAGKAAFTGFFVGAILIMILAKLKERGVFGDSEGGNG